MRDEFKYDVFLSHSAKDKAVVRPLAERLRADGVKVWFDEWVFQPFLNLRSLRLVLIDAVAGLDLPFIEPQPESGLPKPLRQRAHHRLVLRAVAQENIVLKSGSHGYFLFTRYRTPSSLM